MSRSAARSAVGAVALIVLLLTTAACQVAADVLVDVAEDGSGEVTGTLRLDRAAAQQFGDPAQLDLEDLSARGWQVDAPTPGDDGSLVVVARRRFAAPEELPAVLADLAGADGPLSGVVLDVESSQVSTSYRLSGTLESSGDPATFSDPDLTAVLGGLPLGRTADELAAVGADQPGAATLTLRASLPGGTGDEWSVPLTGGSPTSVAVDSSTTVINPIRVTGLLVVAGLLVAAVVLAVRSRR